MYCTYVHVVNEVWPHLFVYCAYVRTYVAACMHCTYSYVCTVCMYVRMCTYVGTSVRMYNLAMVWLFFSCWLLTTLSATACFLLSSPSRTRYSSPHPVSTCWASCSPVWQSKGQYRWGHVHAWRTHDAMALDKVYVSVMHHSSVLTIHTYLCSVLSACMYVRTYILEY